MDKKKIEAIIEGVLFAAGDAVSIESLSDIVDVDTKTLTSIINNISDRYDTEKRGIMIIRLEDSYQMCTRPEYFEYISQLAESKKTQTLSNAAIEVLSIIAYRQPITRAAIEQIRGVSSDHIVARLSERALIKEVGRLDAPGRPMLFATTDEFLRNFDLSTLEELPDYESIRNSAEIVAKEQVIKDCDSDLNEEMSDINEG